MGKEGEKESRERKLPFPSFWVFIPWQKSVLTRKKSSAIRVVALWLCSGWTLGTWWGSAAVLSPGWWQSSRSRVRRWFGSSLVGMELQTPPCQAHTLTVAHGARQTLASSKPQLHLSPEHV